MPDRLLKDGLKTSRRIAAVSERSEMIFVRLILTVCPKGRYHADPQILKQTALTNRPRIRTADVTAALNELERSGLISRYTAPDGSPLFCIPRFGQRLKNTRSPFPAPPEGTPDVEGQEMMPWADVEPPRKKEEKPPAAAGGHNASLDRTERKPRRFRRLPSLDTLRDEVASISKEIDEILRPGGCAYPVEPTGDKKIRCDKLMADRERLQETIEDVREELSRRHREDGA